MGYGDLFVAGILGGMLARGGELSPRGREVEWSPAQARRAAHTLQLRGAALVAGVALLFDLLFFVVDELPATVPVALGAGRALARAATRRAPRRVDGPGTRNRTRGSRVDLGDVRASVQLKPQVYREDRPRELFERCYE